jgi:hypothetical protein
MAVVGRVGAKAKQRIEGGKGRKYFFGLIRFD